MAVLYVPHCVQPVRATSKSPGFRASSYLPKIAGMSWHDPSPDQIVNLPIDQLGFLVLQDWVKFGQWEFYGTWCTRGKISRGQREKARAW